LLNRAAFAPARAWTRIAPISLDQSDHEIYELILLGASERF